MSAPITPPLVSAPTASPSALHRGDDELPWVDAGEGNLIRVLMVAEQQGIFVLENILRGGMQVAPHRHTGPVSAFTVSGAWTYKENDFVNHAGSFLFEPAGSLHTIHCLEDNTRIWFQVQGAILPLGTEGNVEHVMDAGTMLAMYRMLCAEQGKPEPDVIVA